MALTARGTAAAAVAHLAGIKAEHAPQRGTPEAVNDAMAGRVLYAFAPGPNAIPLARAGKLQILATTSPAGARFLPGIPSLKEAGVNYEGDDWFGVFAPAGTPLPIRERMSKEMARILALQDTRDRLVTLGAEPVSSSPENVITRPSPNVVTVGYQRPCAMFCTSVKRPVAGLNTAFFGWPQNGSYFRLPPLTKTRPSERTTMPLQNMSHGCPLITLSVSANTSSTAD